MTETIDKKPGLLGEIASSIVLKGRPGILSGKIKDNRYNRLTIK
jgi:hypothetical protein